MHFLIGLRDDAYNEEISKFHLGDEVTFIYRNISYEGIVINTRKRVTVLADHRKFYIPATQLEEEVMFSNSQLKVIEYCAEEVKRQGDTPNHVYHMLNAWDDAHLSSGKIDLDFIEHIGKLVDPIDNAKGFRTINIYVGNGWTSVEKAKPETIHRKLEFLLEAYYDGSLAWTYKENRPANPMATTQEDQFYFEFEEIHPFRDGNGRTGKVLYNYLSGTLDNPIWPPNFWNVSNP